MPPTEPPDSPAEHLKFVVPWTFSKLQPLKKLLGWLTNLCLVTGGLMLIFPLDALGERVGVPVSPAMPWWGFIALGLFCALLEFYTSNRQELERRNGNGSYPPSPSG